MKGWLGNQGGAGAVVVDLCVQLEGEGYLSHSEKNPFSSHHTGGINKHLPSERLPEKTTSFLTAWLLHKDI